ncbi:uncharacterized protein KGF55_001986 [Candida pseudojiufengensis]|uniref:uncharacterized protein n=1 Tax=Candida pseudojiufengensis TaxID=497109 RepID=UPI002224FF2E|nr:uncharacterized protein KGF55_001986 [Candida pseudojiufengensis]KAI5964044.1 hypothetical protein KGF55_001986 [Candida pseudojiufengensis]
MHDPNWSQINKYWKNDFTQLSTEVLSQDLTGINAEEAIKYFNENLKAKCGLTLDYFETWEYAKADKLPIKILQAQQDTWNMSKMLRISTID